MRRKCGRHTLDGPRCKLLDDFYNTLLLDTNHPIYIESRNCCPFFQMTLKNGD